MININENENPDLYYDVNKCMSFLKNIPEKRYDNNTIFHMYWKTVRPFERKQLLPIKSYLVTQDLSNTSLILWSNSDLSNNEWLKPVLPFITLKIYDPVIEARGTILENKLEVLSKDDSQVYIGGDLFRLLILHNYGGVYVDMDMVLLRDFGPLLSQEFLYKWSFQKEMINGAIMRLFQHSELAVELLKGVLEIPAGGTNWGCQNYMRAKKKIDFTIFPCAFFNTEWQIKLTEDQKSSKEFFDLFEFIQYPFKKTKISNELYDGAFSWHWHNQWDAEIEIGSKFEILEKVINDKFVKKFM